MQGAAGSDRWQQRAAIATGGPPPSGAPADASDGATGTATNVDGAFVASPAPFGRTTIVPLVVERLAGKAAEEVCGGPVRAQAVLDGLLARVRVEVQVPYPGSVRAAAQQVRDRVASLLADLADVDAREVDVVVTGLRAAAADRRRVR